MSVPVRPATSQIAASVSSEIILSVPAFIALFASDLFDDLVQWPGVEGLLDSYGILLEQPDSSKNLILASPRSRPAPPLTSQMRNSL